MPLLHISKAYFKVLITTCKRLRIYNYILSITTNNHVVNNRMCDRFEKHAFKCAKARFESELLPTIFKADKGHI
jgi:sulfatase maturation enzyme AslB (radical SAM superfamily)